MCNLILPSSNYQPSVHDFTGCYLSSVEPFQGSFLGKPESSGCPLDFLPPLFLIGASSGDKANKPTQKMGLSCKRQQTKSNTKSCTWMCILITALPTIVAPKNVQNGTRKCPHVIPARSNKGFGICA